MLSDLRIERYFNLARNASEFSDNKKAKLGAILVYKNKIMSVGWNLEYKSSPIQKEYNRFREFDVENSKNTIHAEISCLSKARYLKIDWAKANLFVYRQKKCGSKGLARPCPACMNYIKSFGLKNIYYTTDDGWGYEKVD